MPSSRTGWPITGRNLPCRRPGHAAHRRHNLLLRLRTRKADVLRFLTDLSVHQQSRRARRADDEIAAENLRWLPLRAGRRGLRRYPIADLDRQKAGLGSAPDTHSRTGASDRHSPLGLTTPPTWPVTEAILIPHPERAGRGRNYQRNETFRND